MSFDKEQSSYKEFRETLKQHTNQVFVWAGAGLSRPAGLPSWPQLRALLTEEASRAAEGLDETGKKKARALIHLAEVEKNIWVAFNYLKMALGETSYTSTIKSAFANASTAKLPQLYEKLWSLGVTGFLTLNIDRFASRAFSAAKPGKGLREFEGVNADKHIDVLRGGTPFVANLHGSIDDQSSWIFTNNEFESLVDRAGYKTLVQTCFAGRTIIFIGISADDPGATKHLDHLKKSGLNLGAHFWLTDRNDSETHEWAERIGIRQILYTSNDGTHSEIQEFVEDLRKYIPAEMPPLPVTPSIKRERGVELPPPEEVEQLKANDIRILLNKEAVRILGSNDPNRLVEYAQFRTRYEEAIYRAWSVNITPGKNMLFDCELQDTIKKGAFGSVYKALDHEKNEIAIKVLHGNIKEDPQMLECFRRGVAAMKILSNRGVPGMVPYIAAWEIPACTTMELIHGPNLEEAVEAGFIDSWQMVLRIALDIVTTIRNAHQLPERVLHRDVRPPNIMLKGWYEDSHSMKVVVLDFDLSWHRDASGLSIDLGKSSNGYVAPEQLDGTRKKLTRNALVDSFGVGMTLYFLATGKHPSPSQHLHREWEKILHANVSFRKCEEWRSLPRRFARLINWATQDIQSNRWDMTRIYGELARLSDSLRTTSKVDSLEMLCEEISARCPSIASVYQWNLETGRASVELKSGFTIELRPDIQERRVSGVIEWLHAGDRPYKDVRKFLGPAADKICSQLKSGEWKILTKDTAFEHVRIELGINQTALNTIEAIQRAANALSTAIETMRFD